MPSIPLDECFVYFRNLPSYVAIVMKHAFHCFTYWSLACCRAEVNNVLPSSREGQPQQAVAAGAALRPDSRQRQQQPSPAHQQASAAAAGGGSDEEADLDFAAMVKDMQVARRHKWLGVRSLLAKAMELCLWA
jgi:hypothetical protein